MVQPGNFEIRAIVTREQQFCKPLKATLWKFGKPAPMGAYHGRLFRVWNLIRIRARRRLRRGAWSHSRSGETLAHPWNCEPSERLMVILDHPRTAE
jgi:hypothetical protein